MILRRFMQHVKEQNWFAVGLDVLVVIVGIFLGMQVTEWNDERVKRIDEMKLLKQLKSEIKLAQKPRNTMFQQLDNRIQSLKNVQRYIDTGMQSLNLSDKDCSNLSISHLVTIIPHNLPTIDEVIANGELGIFTDDAVKEAILSYLFLLKHEERSLNSPNGLSVNLLLKHPEYIQRKFVLVSSEESDVWQLKDVCNFEAMVDNKEISAGLTTNIEMLSMIRSISGLGIGKRLEILTEAIDKALISNNSSNTER